MLSEPRNGKRTLLKLGAWDHLSKHGQERAEVPAKVAFVIPRRPVQCVLQKSYLTFQHLWFKRYELLLR
jgi:hypothetical protein